MCAGYSLLMTFANGTGWIVTESFCNSLSSIHSSMNRKLDKDRLQMQSPAKQRNCAAQAFPPPDGSKAMSTATSNACTSRRNGEGYHFSV
jgi:hypothetical protein